MYKAFWKVQGQRKTMLRWSMVGLFVALLWLVGCQPGQLPQFIPAMRTPMLVPTFTPTPSTMPAGAIEDPTFTDAQGLDIAERRIINV